MPPSFYLPFRPRTCLSPLLCLSFLLCELNYSLCFIITSWFNSVHPMMPCTPLCLSSFRCSLTFQLITSIDASICPCSHFSIIVLPFHHVILFPVQSYKPEESGALCTYCFGGSTGSSPDSLCACGEISPKAKNIYHAKGNMMKSQSNIQMQPKHQIMQDFFLQSVKMIHSCLVWMI